MRWMLIAGGLLALASCGTPVTRESRYTGQITGCGPATPATLARAEDTFTFAPSDGVLVLRGKVAADGSLTATLNTQPPGKPPYVLSVSGHIDPEAVTLRYATPTCKAAPATLARVHMPLL